VALTAFALTADGAFAAKTYNASHSTTANNTIINNSKDENTCPDAGGKVSADEHGQKACSINYNSSK
jgi:hypothetical protein